MIVPRGRGVGAILNARQADKEQRIAVNGPGREARARTAETDDQQDSDDKKAHTPSRG
jgi:hypothetical protein